MRTLYVCLTLVASCFSVVLSQPVDNRILVLGDAFEDVPANQVTLNINLSFSDERDVKLAYQEHQQAQQRLVGLLNQQKIAPQAIRLQEPLGRKGQTYLRGQTGDRFTTYQRVQVKFDDLNQFSQIQQLLTANGFTDLTAVFSVSNQREVESRLLDRALVRAQEKATQLAKATQRTLKRVVRISDTSENEGFYAYRDQNRLNAQQNPVSYDNDALRQMATVPQLFRYGAAVKVEYELNN